MASAPAIGNSFLKTTTALPLDQISQIVASLYHLRSVRASGLVASGHTDAPDLKLDGGEGGVVAPTEDDGAGNVAVATSGDMIQVWDVPLSNNVLEFAENNATARRPGCRSCYPAAFAKILTSKCVFSVRLEQGSGKNNWQTIGICKRGFGSANTDGFGRTVDSWGLADDRSKDSDNLFFAGSGKVVKKWNRKLREGDIVTVTCDLDKGVATIDVNGEVNVAFRGITGTPQEYYMGATFANDHKLRILSAASLALNRTMSASRLIQTKKTMGDSGDWTGVLLQEAMDLRILSMSQLVGTKTIGIPIESAPWLSSPIMIGGVAGKEISDYPEHKFLRKLCSTGIEKEKDVQRLLGVMRRFVLQDRGQDSRANHAANATCAALLWQHNLGGEALEISRGERLMPSDAFRRLWALGQKIRAFLAEGELMHAREQGVLGTGDLEAASGIGNLTAIFA